MKLTKSFNSSELRKDHGNGLVEIKRFYSNRQLECHCFLKNGV